MRKLIFILIAIVSFSQAQTIQYIGAPTTTVISKGNFRTDSIFYLPKRTKTPTDTAAFRYQISDSSLYVWSGYQWLRAGGSGSINGTLTTNYIPKATGTATIGNSLLYVTGDNLLFKSISPWSTNTGWSTFEINASSVALNVFKINDTARGYVAHNGTLMEINNLRNGDLTFVTNSFTRGRFTSGGDFRVNTLGGTGSRVVVASSNGTLSAGSSATDLIDTTYISSRAWRQKGDDSLGAIIATKGSGTVTSVATGYGLSGGTITTTGTLIADTLNLSTRAWRQKGLDSLASLEISGSGTTNYIPKFTNTREIGNSNLINASSGDLLFGTTLNPYAATNRRTFEMNGTNETVIALKRNDLDGAYLYANANDFRIAQTQNLSMTFYTNNTERMRIFQNGRVFVGLSPTDAGYQFDVNGSGRFQQLTSSTNFLDFAHYFYNGGGTNDIYFSTRGNGAGSGNASIINTVSGGRLSFHTNGGAIRFGNTSQTAATANYLSIESNGEILINTTTDAGAYTLQNNGALYNNGNVLINSTNRLGVGQNNPQRRIHISSPDGTESQIQFGQTNQRDYYLGIPASQTYFELFDASVGLTRFRVTSDGESLFGTTTDAGNYRVQVSGNAYVSGSLGVGTTSQQQTVHINSTTGGYIQLSRTAQGGTTSPLGGIYFGDGTTFQEAAILSYADGSVTSGDLQFFTKESSSSLSEAMRITSTKQVAIGLASPDASAKVHIFSTTQGFLPPRMTTTQRDAISSPAAGLVIYNTTTSKLQVYTTSWTDLH